MYQIKYKISDKDYQNFLKYHVKTDLATNIFILLFTLPCAILLALSIIKAVDNIEDIATLIRVLSIFLLRAFSCLIVITLFIMLTSLISKLRFKYLKKRDLLPYGEETAMEFEKAFFTEITPEIKKKWKYSAIDKVATSKHAIYLYTDAIKAIIIPSSVFETAEEKESFLNDIQQNIALAKES